MSAQFRYPTVIAMLLSCLMASCGGGGGDSANQNPQTPIVAAAAPTALSYTNPIVLGASVASTPILPSVMGSVTTYSISPALPAGVTFDSSTGAIAGTPSTATAYAAYTVTASNSAGSTSFALQLAVGEGADLSDVKQSIISATPVVDLSDMAPTSGAPQTVSIALTGATSIALTVQGAGCGTLAASTVSAATLTAAGTVAEFGLCVLQAAITTSAGTQTYTNQFQVTPTHVPPQAGDLSFAGGIYVPSGDISIMKQSADLVGTSASAPQSFINGGTGSILVTTSDPTNVSQALVAFDGIPGYYTAPVTLTNGQLQLQLAVGQDFLTKLAASSAAVHVATRANARSASVSPSRSVKSSSAARDLPPTTMAIAAFITLVGPDGVSPPAPVNLTFQPVGVGPIQVSLSWAAPVDVDLHVQTPAGVDIYYDDRVDPTGGSLDLDSNAGCNIDNVDQENVVWPNSSTPATGNYVVRVDYWSNCMMSQAIPYTVRTTICGVVSTYTGTLDPSQADMGDALAGTIIATVPYTTCSDYSVAGNATYEDYAPTEHGLSTTATELPIRYATVEVHQLSGDAILATGETDATGAYAIRFPMSPAGQYYVKVLASASTTNGAPFNQSVVNSSGVKYSTKSPTQDASVTPHATEVDVASTRAASFAAAFNIYDVGVNAFSFAQSEAGITLPALSWHWTPGIPTCGGNDSCFDSNNGNVIYVSSTAPNSDEYDDSVLAHEFGHFFMANYSRKPADSPATHGAQFLIPAAGAWTEGSATFFGQSVLHSPVYLDTNMDGSIAGTQNLETPGDQIPFSTSTGTLSGAVSEGWVAAVLWDLADYGFDSVTPLDGPLVIDNIAEQDEVFATLRQLKTTTHDRGVAGPDLVDFLDQWLCSSYSTWAGTAGNDFQGIVTKLNYFPYSPAASPACN